MTNPDAWNRLAAVEPADLEEATLELHWATQLLAAAGQTFVAERDDDSHRAMRWETGLPGLLGEGFSEGYPFRLGLRVEELTLVLLDRTDAALGELSLPGVTLDDAYMWLRTGLSQYMGGTGPRIDRPDFAIPAHAVGEGRPFAAGRTAERRALAALYGAAAELLRNVAGRTAQASPVRCWPHHFDIATLLRVRDARDDEPARTVGVGMAPMGGGYAQWYWYVTPKPRPAVDEFPTIEAPAHWHTDGWTGAVLLGSDVVALPDGERRGRVAAFLAEAIAASIRLLGDD